ncbi:restriction endonuclease subunit S [Lactococcus garvieae]|uniref:Restriction endonuclease subunit S n=1 Tax=Lactococcus garvieae TaxID=1363 RepID=A0AA46TVJ3_9LACT|nr:restriction endonuclease subunit S [Lactococcus garvieae]UYT10356.1 restriction endonuclease subunit S [Lactococcus garvieae]
MQQLFPQNGEKFPRVRFINFEAEWKERKLGNIGKVQSGVGFPETEQGGTQGIPFYKVSDMNNLGNETEMKNSNNYVNTEQIMRKKWKPVETVPAIIFAKVGAAIMLNRKRLVKHSFLIDNNTMAYIFYDSWDIKFGKTVFETINLPRYAQVGALPSYNGFDIESIVIKIPNISEQEKIGSFFKELDSYIILHQNKLNQLKTCKKALLQKIFI